jgi:putative iron-dependent peroxidase
MATPQTGVFEEGTRYHYHLEYRVLADDLADVRAALAAAAAVPAFDRQELVLSFGRTLWSRLAPDAVPETFRDFAPVGSAPATQADLWVWLHGSGHDENLERALRLDAALRPAFERTLDQASFVHLDSRDLTGFIDGTANPKEGDRLAVAVVPEGPGAGGSFAFTQRWVHDLAGFGALSVEEQGRVIGRTKVENEELEGDAMPPDSHVARTDVKLDGTALKMWRRSTPWGSVSEHGLQFVAFACEQRRFQIPLERMFGVWEDGLRDRLTEFSTPVTGSYWFTPCQEDLAAALER